jgi:hypothetical protein
MQKAVNKRIFLRIRFRRNERKRRNRNLSDLLKLRYFIPYLKLKSNKKFMLRAVRLKCRSLEFASEEIKSDGEIVLLTFKYCYWVFYFADQKLKSSEEFMLKAVEIRPEVL